MALRVTVHGVPGPHSPASFLPVFFPKGDRSLVQESEVPLSRLLLHAFLWADEAVFSVVTVSEWWFWTLTPP